MNRTQTKKQKETSAATQLLDPHSRLTAWEKVRGMWKDRKPDPIKELAKMRKEWDRKLP